MMTTEAEASALAAIEDWLRRPWFKYPWQVGWILYAANHALDPRATLGEWGAAAMFDPDLPWFARGQAAITAARHGQLPPIERFYDAWERAPAAARPDLLAAVVIGQPDWRDTFLEGARTSVLLATVVALAPDDFREWI